MMHSGVAHVVAPQRRDDGRMLAITLHNRGEQGVLVWAGVLEPAAASKTAEDIESSDYFQRETVSFMSWSDISDYFANRPHAPLLAELMATHKRNDSIDGPHRLV
jgi:hypothetical protein